MKIGDKVSVLDEDIFGIITAVSKDEITIIDSDGFDYQYYKKEKNGISTYFTSKNIFWLSSPKSISI